MARKLNDSKAATSGAGEADQTFTPSGPIYPDPGARSATDANWVTNDMQWKTSSAQQKFY